MFKGSLEEMDGAEAASGGQRVPCGYSTWKE